MIADMWTLLQIGNTTIEAPSLLVVLFAWWLIK